METKTIKINDLEMAIPMATADTIKIYRGPNKPTIIVIYRGNADIVIEIAGGADIHGYDNLAAPVITCRNTLGGCSSMRIAPPHGAKYAVITPDGVDFFAHLPDRPLLVYNQ